MNASITETKTYKLLRLTVNAGFWVSLSLAVIFMLIIILNAFIPDGIFRHASGLSFDGFLITTALSEATDFYPMYLISVVIFLIAGVLFIWILRNIINSFTNGSPFTSVNVSRIRLIGWTLLIQTYLRQTINYLLVQRLYTASIEAGAEPVLKANFTILPEGVIIALCILVLAEIFRYGCALQQEHDTTV